MIRSKCSSPRAVCRSFFGSDDRQYNVDSSAMSERMRWPCVSFLTSRIFRGALVAGAGWGMRKEDELGPILRNLFEEPSREDCRHESRATDGFSYSKRFHSVSFAGPYSLTSG